MSSSNTPEDAARQAANDQRANDIANAVRDDRVPTATRARLEAARAGRLPWLATLAPAELMVARSHGLKPIAAVSATCWMHYGWSWTEGHAQGWERALHRLREEAKAAGANAVLDVKMRTIPLQVESSMDFTLVGTAVHVEGLPPSMDPIVATVPALEFVKLLEADVVATGIAIGAQYDWLSDWRGATNQTWAGNVESTWLSQFWETIRQRAHAQLRQSASGQGNGVLAHVNFGQLFEFEGGENQPKRFLGRQIVIATTVDTRRGLPFPHDIKMVIDLHAGGTALTGHDRHHQSYASNEQTGAI
jgi:Putative heavy-metal-binding